MNTGRREFFKYSAAAAMLISGTQLSFSKNLENGIIPDAGKSPSVQRILPKGLKKGSKVAITASSSPTSMGEITSTIRFYKGLGCEVIIGNTILKQKNDYRYLSASDEVRSAEFMNFIMDDSIDAIICGRGGYGSSRTLRYLNLMELVNHPKILIGFSDITTLLLATNELTGLVTFHGPVASIQMNEFTKLHLRNLIFNDYNHAKITGIYSNMITLVPGVTEGIITGGNLTLICGTLGTPFEINTKGKILFIEEVAENAYEIDRMLMQLIHAGKIEDASAIIFNGFKNLNTRRPFYPNRGYTIREVIDQLIKPFEKPLALGFPFGHEDSMLTLPFGVKAYIDTSKKYFEILEKSVV